MRRFVSVFTSKRDKHGQSDKGSTAGSLSSQMGSAPSKASLKPLTIPFLHSSSAAVTSPASSSYSTPHLSSDSTDPSSHSSGSSNDSASLHVQSTDDRQSLNLKRTDTKRSWKSWMGKKRAGSLKHRDRGDKVATEQRLPPWEPLELPVSPQLLHPTFSIAHDTDDEMQTSSVSELGYVSPSDLITPSQSPTKTTPPSPALALSNFSVLVRNSVLRTAIQPSPFIQPSSGPIYPRSCNRPQVLKASPSLRATTLRRRLHRRLDDPTLSLDDATILALGSRPTPVALSPSVLPDCDVSYPGKSMKILSSSPGLHRWICRPAFEDRFAIFFSTDAGVESKPVSSALAVAALEYSEALDVMVDPDYELVLGKVLPFTPSESSPPSDAPSATVVDPAPMPTIEVPASAPVGLAAQARNSYLANPSPLRIQHTRAPSEASPTILQEATSNTDSISTLQTATPVKKSARASMAVKRVVRFAEDDEDEDDGVPLHLLRVKKKREEKAKFLRMEQQRRMRESFEEQKRQELEAMERERKRVAAQKEREERDKRLFAEQVVASRLRSEQSRAGAYAVDSGSSSSLLVSSATSAHLRDGERNNPRPSKLYSSKHGQTSSHRIDDASSASSRPPSLSFSPSPVSPEHRSRPASTHSNTSSEDIRPSPGSRRDSYASLNSSIRSTMAMPYPMYPMWAGSHQSLNAMQMQMTPNFAAFSAANDMPLLPPNAPFMKQSRQASPSPDRSRRSSTHSQQSSESRDPNRSSTSLTEKKAATPQWPNHKRQSTGTTGARDGERSPKLYPQRTGDSFSSSSMRGQRPPPPPTSQSYSSLPHRGRPPLPNYNSAPQVPTPWTALPTQTGNTPTAMPPSSYSHSLPRSRNSGFVGPMGHDWRSTLIS